jgi:hypothetical protein
LSMLYEKCLQSAEMPIPRLRSMVSDMSVLPKIFPFPVPKVISKIVYTFESVNNPFFI